MHTTKFFLYTRKSTDAEDRQVYSIDHQIAELRQLAAKKDLEVVAEFTENRSAKVPGRPVFNDMLARIKRGEASGILSWSPDRLARNSVDGGQIIHFIDMGLILDLQFPTHTFEPTSAGKLMLNVLFGMSKYYTDSLSDNIKRALRQRIQNGYWARRAPLGYRFDRNTRTIVLDQEKAPLIRKVFELYATSTYTLDQLTETVNAMGLRGFSNKHHPPIPLSRSQYHWILRNPFYTGMMRLNGELYEGKYEPLASNHLFATCQRMMAERGRNKPPVQLPFLYRRMFTCAECGCAITMETQKGHTYLHCTKRKGPCSQPYLRAEKAAQQIESIVESLAIPEDVAAWMINELEIQQKQDTASWMDDKRSVEKKIDAFEIKFQRLTDVYVDGSMAPAEYKKSKEKLLLQKRLLLDKLTFIEKNQNSRFEPAIRFIRGSTEARNVADSGDRLAQRDFLRKTGSNLRIASGRVLFEGRGPWKHVVAAGFSARRVPTLLATGSPAHASIPTLSTGPVMVRALFQSITASFVDHPAWVTP